MKDILQYIPQRPPMVMIGELVRVSETVTTSAFQITEDNILVHEGFFTEAGLVENIAQTAALHTGYNRDAAKPVEIGFIGGVNNLKVHSLPPVGSRIETTIEVLHEVFGATVISGKVTGDAGVIAACQMKIFVKGE